MGLRLEHKMLVWRAKHLSRPDARFHLALFHPVLPCATYDYIRALLKRQSTFAKARHRKRK